MSKYLLILFLMVNISAFSQHQIFRDYNVRDGLPSSTVYGIMQDSNGFMWFCTENGASRFDGKSFKNFTRKDGLTDNTVLDIFQDSQGRIWFFTLNGRLCYYFNGKIHHPGSADSLKSLADIIITARPIEDNEGYLYFVTSSEVWAFKDGQVQKEKIKPSGSDSIGLSLYFNKVILTNITNAQFFLYLIEDTFDFYTNHDIYRHAGKLSHLGNYSMLPHGNNTFNQKKIGNDFWLCTNDDSVVKITGYDTGNPRFQTFLTGFKVPDVYMDSEGNYWFSTIGQGVKFLSSQNKYTIHYDRTEKLPAEVFQATAISPYKGGVLAGTEKPLLVYIKDGKMITIPLLTENPGKANPVYDIYIDSNEEDIYVITNLNFIKISDNFKNQENITMKPENVQAIDPATGYTVYPFFGNFKSISPGPDGHLLLTSRFGVLKYKKQNKGNKNFLVPLTKGYRARNFTGLWSSNGTIWIGNARGLSKMHLDSLVTIKNDNTLIHETISDIKELSDGNLVISTRTSGLYIFNGIDIIEILDESKGLTSDICNKLKVEGDVIWVATADGINKLLYSNGKLIILDKITAANGLLNTEINDMLFLNDTLYVSTSSGITLFPQTIISSSKPPPFHLLSAESGQIDLLTMKKPVLNYKQNYIRFRFIGISFGEPDKVEYAYRLLGVDQEWQINNSGSIDYPSLNPGNYIFEIRARNINSEWSDSILFPFEIKAPFWAQVWFQISGLSGFAILVWFAFFIWFKRRRILIERKLQLQNRIIQLEHQALNAMMNPHFIFNSLNSIQQYLLQNNPQAVNKYLSLFAKLTRMNMKVLEKGEVTLDDEIERLEMYLKLEKLRFGEKLEYQIEIPDSLDTDELILPPMILQPFVENAIWHGIMPQAHGGQINIKVYDPVDGQFLIEISDNGIGISRSEQLKKSRGINHDSRGMKLIRERLDLWSAQYGKKISIELNTFSNEKGDSFGTIVSITLPVVINYEYN